MLGTVSVFFNTTQQSNEIRIQCGNTHKLRKYFKASVNYWSRDLNKHKTLVELHGNFK